MKNYISIFVLTLISIAFASQSIAQSNVKYNGLKGHFDIHASGGYSGSTVKNLITTSNGDESPDITLKGAKVSSEGIYFDGVDDYASFVDILHKSGGTLSWWMKPTKDNTNFDIIGHDFNYSLSNLEYRDLGDKAFLYAETYNNCNYFNSAEFDDFYNSWHMVTVVFQNELATYYIDGTSVGSVANYGKYNCSGGQLYNLKSDFSFNSIGATKIGYSNFYKGFLNKILVYNRALSANEVSFNYNSTKIDYGYSGTPYYFTTAGASGRFGPTQSNVNSAYRGSTLENKVSIHTRGIQEWTVPNSGIYEITAKGAGRNENKYGGAIMRGKVGLKKGEVLKILVGQNGSYGGGSGGSFVVRSPYNTADSPIVVAGGIGGSYYTNKYQRKPSTSTSGRSGNDTGGGGGRNGGGGGGAASQSSESGAGGGGFLGNGGRAARYTSVGGGSGGNGTDGGHPNAGLSPSDTPGKSFVNGGVGGRVYNHKGSVDEGYGGFGGGAGGFGQNQSGAGLYPAGGGGGYSGGGGGGGYYYREYDAGGGGSYFNAEVFDRATTNGNYNNVSDYVERIGAWNKYSQGKVIIKYLGADSGLSIPYDQLKLHVNYNSFQLPYTTNSSGQIQFESSNTEIATVDSSGKVSIHNPGKVIIKVTQEASGDYVESAALVSLFINRSRTTIGSSIGYFEKSVAEDESLSFTTPNGEQISEVIFANYGQTKTTSQGLFYDSCYTFNALGIVESAALNKNSFSITANNDLFGDPCRGTVKELTVKLAYTKGLSDLDKTYGDADFTRTFVSNSPAPFTVKSSNSNVIKVLNTTSEEGKVTVSFKVVGGGSAKITVSQSQNNSHKGSTASFNVNVAKLEGDLSIDNLSKTYGDIEFTPSVTSSSNGSIAFTSSNSSVAKISGSKVNIIGVGTTELTATQAESNNYLSSSDKAILTVKKAKTTIEGLTSRSGTIYESYIYEHTSRTFTAPKDAIFTKVTYASYGNSYSKEISSSCHAPDSKEVVEKMALGKNNFTIKVTNNLFAGGDPCPGTPKKMHIEVKYQYVGKPSDHNKTFGDANFDKAIYSNSPESFRVSSSNPDVVAVSNTQSGTNTVVSHQIKNSGSAVITISQPSSDLFESDTVTYTVTVGKVKPNLKFENSITKTFEDPDFIISATSSSTGAIQYSSSDESIASVYDNVIRINGAGTAMITASQESAGNYASSTATTKLVVSKAEAHLQPYGYLYVEIPEGTSKTLSTPNGEQISKVVFASYGTPSGSDGAYKIGSCHAAESVSKVKELVLGKSSVSLSASNTIFGDPCNGTAKALYVKVKYLKASKLTDQTLAYLGADFTKLAQSTSDGQMTVTSLKPDLINVSKVQKTNTTTITHQIKGAGTTVIKINQAASSNYKSTVATYTLTVNKGTSAISLSDYSKTYGDANFTLSATSSSTGDITYSSSNSDVISINGSTASIKGAGTAIITVSQAEDANFSTGTATATITVGKQQPIFLEEGFVYGTANERNALSLSTPNGQAIQEVVFASYGNPSGTNGNFVQGSCHATSSKAKVEAVALGKSSFRIVASNSLFGDPCGGVAKRLKVKAKYYKPIEAYADLSKLINAADFTRSIQTNSTGAFTVSSSNSNVISVSNTQEANTTLVKHQVKGAGTAIITVSQAESEDQAAISTSYTVTVNKLDPNLILSSMEKNFSDFDFEAPYSSSSSATVMMSSSDENIASVSGTTITIQDVGTVHITVAQAENNTYNSATVSALLTISKSTPTISGFDAITTTYGTAELTLNATTDSTSAISYSVADHSIATVSGTTLILLGAGTTEISASVGADFEYAAYEWTKTLTVEKKSLAVDDVYVLEKTYDGTTNAEPYTDFMSVNGIINGDDVTIEFSGTFEDKHIGTSKTVNLTPIVTGADKDNYSLGTVTTTGVITTTLLHINGVEANDKDYDAKTSTSVDHSGIIYNGLIEGDDVSAEFSGAFEDANMGTTKTVNLTVEISGVDKGNYVISYQTTTTASINPPTSGWKFTNAGATGRYGPTQSNVDTAYSGSYLEGSVTVNTQGFQEWSVPETDTYIIEVAGAKGAGNGGGDGAIVKGTIDLTQGDVLKIAVGQRGVIGTGYDTNATNGGGGGGGTFVIVGDTPIMVAGGGGGGNGHSGNDYYPDVDNNKGKGLTLISGSSTNQGGRGVDGHGGAFGKSSVSGSGGAGFYSNGGDNTLLKEATGGKSYANGFIGGTADNRQAWSSYTGGHGGFGGGGAAMSNSLIRGGGGGGFSGGQGGTYDDLASETIYNLPKDYDDIGYGGGGGSYIDNNFYELATSDGSYDGNSVSIGNLSKYNDGHGYVKISKLCESPSLTVSSTKSVTYGGAPFTMTYSSVSSGTVMFSSSDDSIASIDANTGEVTINGGGEVILTAYQLGTLDYCPSSSSMVLTVNRATPVLSGDYIDYSEPFITVGETHDAGITSTSKGAITYSTSNETVMTVSGTILNPINVGDVIITMTQEATANYNSTEHTITFYVDKAIPNLDHIQKITKTYGDAPFEFPYTTDNTSPINLTSMNPEVATVSGTTITIHAPGIADIFFDQVSDENYSGYGSAVELAVQKALAPIEFSEIYEFYGAEPFALSATSTSTGAFSYSTINSDVATISGTTLTIVGGGTAVISASQEEDANYRASTVTTTLTVLRIDTSLSGLNDMNKYFGQESFELSAISSSTGEITYNSSDPSVATVHDSRVFLNGIGSTMITATQEASANYNSTTAAALLTVSGSTAEISNFNTISKVYGDADFDLSATSSSTGVFTYSSSNNNVAVVNGSTVSIVGVGTTELTAYQSANGGYQSNSITTTLEVVKATPRIEGLSPLSKTFGTDSFNLSATSSSTGAITYSSSNTDVALIDGTEVTLLGTGSVVITATQEEDANFIAASISTTLNVQKATTVLDVVSRINKTVVDEAFEVEVVSSRPGAISFSSSNPSVATVSGTLILINGVGTTTITAVQQASDNHHSATVTTSLIVDKAIASILEMPSLSKIYGEPDFQLEVSSTSSGTLSYSSSNADVAAISGTTVTIVGVGSTTISIDQVETEKFKAASTTMSLEVLAAESDLRVVAPDPKTYGDESFELTSMSSNSNPVIYTSYNESVATISGTTVSIVGAGQAVITATQSASVNYNAASFSTNLIVEKATPSLTGVFDRELLYGEPDQEFFVSSLSTGAISYTADDASVIAIDENQFTIEGVGEVEITVSQEGDENYQSVEESMTYIVHKAPSEIEGLSNVKKLITDQQFELNLSSNNPDQMNISIADPSIATLSGTTVVIKGAGSTQINVSQDENENFESESISATLLVQNQVSELVGFKDRSVVYGNQVTLTATSNNTDGTIYYSSSDEAIASVNSRTGELISYTTGEVTISAVELYFDTYVTATASAVITITKRPFVVEEVVVVNKTYDGTRYAFVDESKTKTSGLVNGDDLRVNVQASFDDPNVGPYKQVSLVNTIIGEDMYKYELQPLDKAIASIYQKEVRVSGIKALNKIYDGKLTAQVDFSEAVFEGMIEGESLSIKEVTANFETKQAGRDKKVYLSTTYQGADSSNYKMVDQEIATASINKKPIELVGATIETTQMYDGLTYVNATGQLYTIQSNLVSGDLVDFYGKPRFESPNAGTQNIVQGSLRIDGADASNYELSWTNGSGTITPRLLNVLVQKHTKFDSEEDPVFSDVLYSGDGFAPGESLEDLEGELVISRTNTSEEVGNYTGVLVGSGLSSPNYNISYTAGDFEIVPINQLMLDIDSEIELVYTSEATYSVTASYASETNTSRSITLVDVAVSYDTKTGMYSFDQDTPSGPISGSFKVDYQPLGATGKVDPSTFTSKGGFTNSGVYTLQPSEVAIESDFLKEEVSYKGVVEVKPKSITPVISSPSKAYDGTADVPATSVVIEGFESGDDVSATYEAYYDNAKATSSKNVTVEAIQLIGSDAANYTLSTTTVSSTEGIIEPKSLTIDANSVSKVYDGTSIAELTETYIGFIEGEDESYLEGSLVRSGAAINAKTVGTYDYSISGLSSDNYEITYKPGTLTIEKAPLNISGVSVYNKTYDGTTTAVLDTSLVAYFGLIQGEDVSIKTVDAAFESSKVGEHKVHLTNYSYNGSTIDNYVISEQASTTARIRKAPLQVKVTSVVSPYSGEVYQNFKVTYEGFVNGEDESVLDGNLMFSGEGSTAVNPGAYELRASGLTSENYEIYYIDGVYTILDSDVDGDGISDSIDTDIDGDGWSNIYESQCGSDPLDALSILLDNDQDGIPDCIDIDDDNDGVLDVNDSDPLSSYESVDSDGDGTGNNTDTDDDNDGQLDIHELACGSDPLDASSMSIDTDVDSIPDCVDTDDDNDGILDVDDQFPLEASESIDTDGDGIGNNTDTDDDNDGFSDEDEIACGANPLEIESQPGDYDSDGIADCIDSDMDGDGVANQEDQFPLNAFESIDSDGDGVGNNTDADDDNDGVLDSIDAFPLDSSEAADADGDGIGDNADRDQGNDGFDDSKLEVSGALTPNQTGVESTWKIANINLHPHNRVRVYDKNGRVVFSKENYQNDWRGNFKDNNELLPSGSYFYKVYLYDTGQTLSGWLLILY